MKGLQPHEPIKHKTEQIKNEIKQLFIKDYQYKIIIIVKDIIYTILTPFRLWLLANNIDNIINFINSNISDNEFNSCRIAEFDAEVIRGATMLLLLNLFGIIAIAVIIFLLMNLGDKQNIAESTIKREEEKLESETKAIAEVTEQITVKTHTETDAVIIEDRIVEK